MADSVASSQIKMSRLRVGVNQVAKYSKLYIAIARYELRCFKSDRKICKSWSTQ